MEHAYGADHAQVAVVLNNLGNAWRQLGEPGKARELYERALRILRTAFPSGHPDTDAVIQNLRSVVPDIVVLDVGRIVHRAERPPPDSSHT
jgi:tetratricopeptide (TPR) repeat protein